MYGLSSVKFDTFFEFSPCGWTRGHSLKLNKNRVRIRTDLRQHFFSERVISTWNKLDNDTVCASSVLICFKRHQEKLHKDESFHRLLYVVHLAPEAEPVFPHGEASSGKLSGKLSGKKYLSIINSSLLTMKFISIILELSLTSIYISQLLLQDLDQ